MGTIVIQKPARTIADQSYVVEIVKGVGVTLKHFFRSLGGMVTGNRPDPTVQNWEEGVATLEYPEQKRPYA